MRPIAVKDDWDIEDMPQEQSSFVLSRHFSEEEIENLRYGNIPKEMEDKWFWYMEEDTLYAHRSWSGLCIYIVKFDFSSDEHLVTVNNSPDQYTFRGDKEESSFLNGLFDWWVRPQYDYYHEWISETVDSINHS